MGTHDADGGARHEAARTALIEDIRRSIVESHEALDDRYEARGITTTSRRYRDERNAALAEIATLQARVRELEAELSRVREQRDRARLALEAEQPTDSLVAAVQFRRCDCGIEWRTMAAFDQLGIAERYRDQCSRDHHAWEYRVVPLAARAAYEASAPAETEGDR